MDDGQLYWAQQQRRPGPTSVPLGVVLGGLTEGSWFKRQQHLGQFVSLLEKLLPAELSGRVSLEGFNRNVLHLAVDSAGHRYEMQLRKDQLLSAMNEQLSGVFVRDIRLSLQPPPTPPPPRAL
ncbi:MAG: hypothetical protein BIFFINMI_03404 [Phycisphaerae bacterium]|nr:hypothetical protein [Phycisphaerae bacterium]